jgi:hypothetical protein
MIKRHMKNEAPACEAMLSQEEVSFYKNPGISLPEGNIVELGCWLGASTIALNTHLDGYAHYVYDRFTWEPYMSKIYRGKEQYKVGDSFKSEFRYNVRYLKGLHINQVDLHDFTFPALAPIKLLFFDALKDMWLAQTCLRQLLSQVVVGSLIMDQDFLYKLVQHSYMHLFMWRLRKYVEPYMYAGHTVAWIVTCEIPKEVVIEATSDVASHYEYNHMSRYWLTTIGDITQ